MPGSPEVLLTAAFVPAALSVSLSTLSVSERGLFSSCSLCLSADPFCVLWGLLSVSVFPSVSVSLCLSASLSISLSPLCLCLSPMSLCPSPWVSPCLLSLPSIHLSPPLPSVFLPICLSTPSLFISMSVSPPRHCLASHPPSLLISAPFLPVPLFLPPFPTHPSLRLCLSPPACPKPLTWTITGWPRPG